MGGRDFKLRAEPAQGFIAVGREAGLCTRTKNRWAAGSPHSLLREEEFKKQYNRQRVKFARPRAGAMRPDMGVGDKASCRRRLRDHGHTRGGEIKLLQYIGPTAWLSVLRPRRLQ